MVVGLIFIIYVIFLGRYLCVVNVDFYNNLDRVSYEIGINFINSVVVVDYIVWSNDELVKEYF